MKWLRTCLRKVNYKLSVPDATYEETFEGIPMLFLRGLRSDGQMFLAYAPVGSDDATPEILRLKLDSMLNDPPLSGVVNFEEMQRNMAINRYKGLSDWVEEKTINSPDSGQEKA